jgi:hypothetical protein
LKTIEYALPATTIGKKDMDRIMQPILELGLAKSGICRKIARQVFFPPIRYQGIGLKHPYITQGIKQIEAILNTSTVFTSKLILKTWNRTKTERGYGDNFLEKDGM